jgi:uncharacterized RDD family membrane protein YckC
MTPRRIFLSILVALALATAATPSAQTPLRPEPDPSKPQPAVEPRIERPDTKPDYPRDQIEAVQRRLQRLGGRVEMQSGPVIRLGTERVQIFRDYTLPRNEEVRELIGVLGDLRIEGRVSRNAVVTAGDLTLSPTAHVEGTVAVIGGSLTVEKGAFVGHEVIVIGGTANLPEGFQTSGEHVIIGTPEIASALRGVYPWVTRGLIFGRLIVPDLDWTWTVAVLSFLLGFVLNLLFNRPVRACADALARRPMSAFFVGILALLVAPLLFTLVAATVVGLLVVPFAIAAFIAAGMIGKVGVSRALGRGVAGETDPADRGQAARSFTIGAVLITLTYLLPVFGLIVWGMVGIFGLGAATMTMSGRLRRERPATPPFAPAGPAPATPPVAPPPAPAAAPAMTYAASAPPEPAFVSAPVTPAPEPATFAGTGLGEAGPAPSGPAMGRAASTQPLPPGSDLTLYPRATFFDRIAAMALDLMLIGIAMNLLDPRHIDSPPFVIIVFLYHVAFWAWKGTTLGGIVCNVRIVRTNGEPPRFIDALVRGLSGIFSVAALFIGVLWMLNDAEKQMWHDKIAGTVVVKLPRELVLA